MQILEGLDIAVIYLGYWGVLGDSSVGGLEIIDVGGRLGGFCNGWRTGTLFSWSLTSDGGCFFIELSNFSLFEATESIMNDCI